MIRFDREYPSPYDLSQLQGSSFEQRLNYRLAKAGLVGPYYLITDEDRQRQYGKLEKMIGNTPITAHKHHPSLILVKHLSQNPSECHYDPVYLATLRKLEEKGIIWPKNRNQLHEGKHVELLELTSGSAGISFGLITKVLGFDGTILVPPELPDARIQPMSAMGLKIVKTNEGYIKSTSSHLRRTIVSLKAEGYKDIIFDREEDKTIVLEKDNHRVVIVNHSDNVTSPDAHKSVGIEIGEFLPERVSPNYLVLIVGNFTSSTGICAALRERFPQMKIVGLESTDNPDFYEQRYPGKFKSVYGRDPEFKSTRIFGTSVRGVPLRFANADLFDEIKLFEPQDAISYMQDYNGRVNRSWTESIGATTAACYITAENIGCEDPKSVIVTINYDKGDRYDEFVPGFIPSLSLMDAAAKNRFEASLIQPFGWKQIKAETIKNIPSSLRSAYGMFPC